MILLRSFFAEIILLVYLNKEMYSVMTKQSLGSDIVIRITIAFISIGAMFTSVHHFSLTTVAVAMNLSPVFSFVFGMLLLGEKKATGLDVVCLVLSMVGALMMILAAIKEKEAVEQEKEYTILYVLVLILLPFSKSMGQLMTRKMRKMHENTISCF